MKPSLRAQAIKSDRWHALPQINLMLAEIQDLRAETVPDLAKIAEAERRLRKLEKSVYYSD